jgi:hypothetical protein
MKARESLSLRDQAFQSVLRVSGVVVTETPHGGETRFPAAQEHPGFLMGRRLAVALVRAVHHGRGARDERTFCLRSTPTNIALAAAAVRLTLIGNFQSHRCVALPLLGRVSPAERRARCRKP